MFIDKDGEFPINPELLFKTINWFRKKFTSEDAATKLANKLSVTAEVKKNVMFNVGVLDGALSTIDLKEIKEDLSNASKKFFNAKHQLGTFNQLTEQDIRDNMLPDERIILEQSEQLVYITEHFDELSDYQQGQVTGVVLATIGSSLAGGLKGGKIPKLKLAKLKLRLSKLKLKFKIGSLNEIYLKNTDNFIEINKKRLNTKLGKKIGQGRLSFEKSAKGVKEAIDMVKKTLDNRTSVSKIFRNSNGDKVRDIYSKKTGHTVRVRVETGEFDTLIEGATDHVKK